MYTALELRTLNIKPRINDISLKILSEYYQMFLAPFIYNYHIVSKTEEKDIKLNFGMFVLLFHTHAKHTQKIYFLKV